MGGFFASDPPSPPPPPSLPPLPEPPDPEIAAAAERMETVNRNRRGLLGTVAGSETGFLRPRAAAKTLLGE